MGEWMGYVGKEFMDVVLMILYGVLVLGFLVVIHEGGHYCAARAFGVRVTEFMVGLPGPRIGFLHHGTRFGVTAIPLGGYARVCGMEAGEESPHLQRMLTLVYERGEVLMEDAARALSISDDEAYRALDELLYRRSAVTSTISIGHLHLPKRVMAARTLKGRLVLLLTQRQCLPMNGLNSIVLCRFGSAALFCWLVRW